MPKITQRMLAPVFAAIIALSFLPCASAQQPDIVITAATLIDGTGAAPRPGTTIIVRGDSIVAVAPDGTVPVASGANIINAAGMHVIPGLADMHVHFGLGAPLPRRRDETAEVLARELYYGVTTILQLGGTDASTDSIRALRARRLAGTIQAPYIYGTGGHLTLQGTHPVYTIFPRAVREAADSLAAATPLSDPVNLYPFGIGISFVRTEEAARKAVRERAAGGMDAIKITVESGPTPFGDDHPQMSVEMIRAIIDEAARHGLRVFAHVTSPDELEAVLKGGAAGVVHAVQDRPLPRGAIANQMAAAGFVMVPTLTLYDGLLRDPEPGDLEDPFLRATASDEEVAALMDPEFVEHRRQRGQGRDLREEPGRQLVEAMMRHFDDMLVNVGMLHRRGVEIALGTDTGNPYVFPGYSVHRELELLVRAGLTPMEALEAATRRAAEMIGAEDEFGTIQPGKRADLLILGANPLQDIRNTRTLKIVIAGGRVVDREALLGIIR